MSSNQLDQAQNKPTYSDRAVEQLRAQVLLTWEKEGRTLEWFGLQDGMRVLELGCGPGFISEQLLMMLPHSHISALDIDPTLLERAKAYLGTQYDDRLRFIEASIMDTELPADSFDFALARLIFQHLPDPAGAAAEIFRVLKPGGKLVISDVDDAIWGLTDPVVPEMDIMREMMFQAQAARGGNRYIGRRLWSILDSAGFVNLDVEVILAHSDRLGMEPFLPILDSQRLISYVEKGQLSEQVYEQIKDAFQAFIDLPDAFLLGLALMACGEKPA
jgi:ubiquinone/menaquinone biosynthesis C-methylase UbiE